VPIIGGGDAGIEAGRSSPSRSAHPRPVAIADDLTNGMIDRFRALPIPRSAVLAGRVTADAVRNLAVLALMTGVAAAIGFRFHAGPAAALAAVTLAVAVGVAFSWIFSLLGLLVRDAESAGIGGLLAVIPLIFTSSTFVPTATFPGWLQAFAKINPITVTVDAIRALTLGGPTVTPVARRRPDRRAAGDHLAGGSHPLPAHHGALKRRRFQCLVRSDTARR
jgi:ABC transporter DrrB family efflux protein